MWFAVVLGNHSWTGIPLFALLNLVQKDKYTPESLQARNKSTSRHRQTIHEGNKDTVTATGQSSKVFVTCLQRIVMREFSRWSQKAPFIH